MSSLLIPRRDLEFLLYEWLNVPALTRAERYADHSRETFDAVLDTYERIATERFAPHNRKADQHEPHFDGHTVTMIDEVKPALRAFAEAGLTAASQDYALGGMQLPMVVATAGLAYLYARQCRYQLVSVTDRGQRESAAGTWQRSADQDVRGTGTARSFFRHDVFVGAASGFVAIRHRYARRTGWRFALRPALPR